MKTKALKPTQIADHCVHGDAKHKPFEKHVLGVDATGKKIELGKGRNKFEKNNSKFKENEFKSLGIHTREQYRQHIVKTLKDPETVGIKAPKGCKIYYNKKTNTLIVQNNRKPTKSTCYRPTDKEFAFNRKAQDACIRRGIPPEKWKQETKAGGYSALHPKKEKNVERKSQETDKERRSRQVEEYMKRQEAQRQKGRER